MFPREIWNSHDNIFHRTNNISKTYNKKINKEIAKSRRTKEDLKELKYDINKIEMMDYLMLISEYVQDFD